MEVWKEGVAWLGSQEHGRVKFTGDPGPNCTETSGECLGSIAVDDILLDGCLEAASDLDCAFDDKTLCGWVQSQEDDKDWEIVVGKDHTTYTDSGGYIRMWSSSGEERAVLESPMVPPRAEVCFGFWYKMYGDEVGQLRVVLKSNDSYAMEPVVLWEREGSQGAGWLHAEARFRKSTNW